MSLDKPHSIYFSPRNTGGYRKRLKFVNYMSHEYLSFFLLYRKFGHLCAIEVPKVSLCTPFLSVDIFVTGFQESIIRFVT